jgi:imidazolonepropionase-like amidohydrolase
MNRIGLLATLFCAIYAHAETKVLRNFILIDGSGKPAVAGAAMVIVDGRIRSAGPAASIKSPAGAEEIDLRGKYIMPGIINLHGHLGNTIDLTQDPKFYTRENVEKNLKTYASYGVTSMLSMGTDKPLIYEIRAEQRRTRPTMTRVYTAGRGFTGAGGYPTTVPGMKGVPYEVSTEADVAKDVAELAKNHPDIVKIWVDDHLGKQKKIPLNLTKAIISDAHNSGLKVGAHIFYLDDAKALVAAGLNGLAHSVRDKPVDDELIGLMKRHGAWQQAATLAREASTFVFGTPAPFLNDPFFIRSVSPQVVQTLASKDYQAKVAADVDFGKYPGFLEMAKRNLKRLADAGVKYGFGTDTGPPARFPGYFEHWEMQLMVEAGLTPMQVITAASRSSAEFLGVSKDFGALEPGKWADLIVLGKDPLSDIRNTRTIEAVYIAGNRVR